MELGGSRKRLKKIHITVIGIFMSHNIAIAVNCVKSELGSLEVNCFFFLFCNFYSGFSCDLEIISKVPPGQ